MASFGNHVANSEVGEKKNKKINEQMTDQV